MSVTIRTKSGNVATYANGVWKCNRVGLLRYIEILDKADFSRHFPVRGVSAGRSGDEELRKAESIAVSLGGSVIAYSPDEHPSTDQFAELTLMHAGKRTELRVV